VERLLPLTNQPSNTQPFLAVALSVTARLTALVAVPTMATVPCEELGGLTVKGPLPGPNTLVRFEPVGGDGAVLGAVDGAVLGAVLVPGEVLGSVLVPGEVLGAVDGSVLAGTCQGT